MAGPCARPCSGPTAGPPGPCAPTGSSAPGALARLANPLAPGMTGPMLKWVAEHEPRTYPEARWALQPKDWLRARLTGEFHAEPSDASATLLYDVMGDRWDLEVVSALGLDAGLLAPLLPSAGAPAGHLTAEAEPSWGCPRASPSRPGPPTRRRRPWAAGSAAGRHPADRRHRRAGHPAADRTGQPGGRRDQPVPVGDSGRLVPDGRHRQRGAQPQLGAGDHERQPGRSCTRAPIIRARHTTRSSSRTCRGNGHRTAIRRSAAPGPRCRWPTTGPRSCGARWKEPRSRSATRWTPCSGSIARRSCGWPAGAPWPPAGGSCSRMCWGCRCTPWTCPRRPAGARPCSGPAPPACSVSSDIQGPLAPPARLVAEPDPAMAAGPRGTPRPVPAHRLSSQSYRRRRRAGRRAPRRRGRGSMTVLTAETLAPAERRGVRSPLRSPRR